MGYVGWGLVAEQANTTTGGAQRTVGITSSPGAGIAQSSLNSVNNGGGGVVNNYGAVWDNLFVRQYLFGRGEQGAWFDPSDFQPNWRRNLLTWTEQFDNAAWVKTNSAIQSNLLTWSEQFDNAAWTKFNSFIQTNLLTWSEQFDNAIWSKQTNVTIAANVVIAPDGTTTADRVDWASAAINTGVLQTGIPINGAPNTKSIYVRADSAGGTIQLADPNLTVGITTATLTTDWQRIVLSEPAGSQPTNAGLWVRKTASSPSSIYIWGAQLVEGSVPGDYQQTTSAAAAVQYAAPNGTLTADKLVENTANTLHRVSSGAITPTVTGTFTTSIAAKAGERTWLVIQSTLGSNNTTQLFNLSTGSLGIQTGAGGTATITNLGAGWYRCTLTTVTTTTSAGGCNFYVSAANSDAPYLGDGTSGIYIWGAQLVQGSASVAYQPTTSATVVIPYSAPDGTTTADKLIPSSAVTQHVLYQLLTQTAQAYSNSVYIKYIDLACRLRFSDWGAVVSVSSSGVSSVSGTTQITAVGNGWYRVAGALDRSAGSNQTGRIVFQDNSGVEIVGFDGTSGVLIWGAQVETGTQATAYQPITDGIVDYFTYQPQPILYQDSSGTTPVTALEQPCGLMLDKSKGLQLGPELVTNGSFTTDTDWTKGVGWTISGGAANANIATGSNLDQTATTTSGKFYAVTYTVLSYVSGGVRVRFTGTANVNGTVRSANGTYTEYINATATNNVIRFTDGGAGFVGSIDNISVRELPGNHAYQTTSSKRPVVSARVNLLTYTEQFDNAVWTKVNATVTANAITAPNGTLTANRLLETAANGVHLFFTAGGALNTAAQYSFSVRIKGGLGRDWARVSYDGGGAKIAWFNITTGTIGTVNAGLVASIVADGEGFYVCTISFTGAASGNFAVGSASADGVESYTGDITKGIFVWGADLRPADQATGIMPRYQRVGAATSGTSTAAGVADYDSVGFPVYLRTDGIDDAMLTNSIDFSAGPTNPPLSADRLTSTWILGAGATESPTGTFNFSSSGASIRQDGVLTSGRSYIVSFTATGSGNLNVHVGDPAAGSSDTTISSTGTYRFCLVCDGVDNDFQLRSAAAGGFVGTVTNLSVKEITDVNLGADKVTVFAGVRKLSDAAQAVVTELSTSIANPGAFAFYAPSAAGTDLSFFSGGTTFRGATQSGFASPITAVASGIGNISGDSAILRVNGTQVASNTSDQGTGNFGNYPLYLFARNQTSLFFTGNFYGLIVRGAQTDTSLITTTEEYIANVTGFGAPVVVGTPSIGVSI